ncbi:MAG: hypothetical protein IJ060_09715 [Oscillospiraceae bacterium]|nr:hypothetical protein [Oscillospiraceae bacterium]
MNKARILPVLLPAICCILCGCGKKDENSEKVKGSESRYSTQTFRTHERTLGGISTEIPADACVKVSRTSVDSGIGKPLYTNVEYRNDHGDPLLEYEITLETGEQSDIKCCEYEYNDKGQKLWECEYSTVIGEQRISEMYYQYIDGIDAPVAQEHYEDGVPSFLIEEFYDDYGNYLGVYYEFYDRTDPASHKKEIYTTSTEVQTECEYDDSGHLLKSRMYNSEGRLKSETTYSYDENGSRIAEDAVYQSDVKAPYYRILKESRYDDRGNAVFSENTYWEFDNEISKKTTYEREYDAENRLIQVVTTYLDGGTETTTYSYEPL